VRLISPLRVLRATLRLFKEGKRWDAISLLLTGLSSDLLGAPVWHTPRDSNPEPTDQETVVNLPAFPLHTGKSEILGFSMPGMCP